MYDQHLVRKLRLTPRHDDIMQVFSSLPQEYRARKRQRLQKKVADQLRASLQQGQAAAALGATSDLQQVLNSFTGQSLESAAFHSQLRIQSGRETRG